jgi:hypothetical protein
MEGIINKHNEDIKKLTQENNSIKDENELLKQEILFLKKSIVDKKYSYFNLIFTTSGMLSFFVNIYFIYDRNINFRTMNLFRKIY